jgi:hypothetical protein
MFEPSILAAIESMHMAKPVLRARVNTLEFDQHHEISNWPWIHLRTMGKQSNPQ